MREDNLIFAHTATQQLHILLEIGRHTEIILLRLYEIEIQKKITHGVGTEIETVHQASAFNLEPKGFTVNVTVGMMNIFPKNLGDVLNADSKASDELVLIGIKDVSILLKLHIGVAMLTLTDVDSFFQLGKVFLRNLLAHCAVEVLIGGADSNANLEIKHFILFVANRGNGEGKAAKVVIGIEDVSDIEFLAHR